MRSIEIDENTKIPLRVVYVISSLLVCGAFFATIVWVSQGNTTTRVDALEASQSDFQKKISDDLGKVKEDVAHIRGVLDARGR